MNKCYIYIYIHTHIIIIFHIYIYLYIKIINLHMWNNNVCTWKDGREEWIYGHLEGIIMRLVDLSDLEWRTDNIAIYYQIWLQHIDICRWYSNYRWNYANYILWKENEVNNREVLFKIPVGHLNKLEKYGSSSLNNMLPQ